MFIFQVVKNCDELFEKDELSAVPDVGWPDCFNSGVFVYRPNEDTYKAIINFAVQHGSFDGKIKFIVILVFTHLYRHVLYAEKTVEKIKCMQIILDA